ncbi:MAG TPA: sulfite exporter TauE/SafE family protein [Crinalium sp.]|jgi:ABC-type nickel/cobalt efflux system permease component RcnA
MKRIVRLSLLGILSCLAAMLMCLITASPSQAHWADLSAAEIIIDKTTVQMTLTYPTGLTPFADGDRNQQLSPSEIREHSAELKNFFNQQIQFTDSENRAPQVMLAALEGVTLSPNALIAPSTHTTLRLTYTWPSVVQGLKIHYGLFLPGVSTASCLATLLQDGHLKTVVFTPKHQSFGITPGLPWFGTGEVLLAIAGAFLWGATHSMSPGHGKTLVGAYLVGERATPIHAVFLAMTTTVTHTIGVFALGLVTLFAARYILPEQLYPWLSMISGLMVVSIGVNLFRQRLRMGRSHPHSHHHGHDHHHHHSHSSHHHHHHHHHHHDSAKTSHLPHLPHPPHLSEDAPITWRSLLALGISGGLIPCPAALVLLLSAIALGNVGLGLALVLAFSLGLALVLTSLGLVLVYAKRLFKRVPTQMRFAKFLPAMSALCITLIGLGISAKAMMQIQLG